MIFTQGTTTTELRHRIRLVHATTGHPLAPLAVAPAPLALGWVARVVGPDGRARSMIGLNPLDITKAPISVTAGEQQAERVYERVANLWS